MDLLHKRYASPFFFIDNLIENCGFNDYVQYLLNKVQEEKNQAMEWEFYLHKVHDRSFNEWKAEMRSQTIRSDVMTEAKKEEIVSRSEAILNSFNILPDEGGG